MSDSRDPLDIGLADVLPDDVIRTVEELKSHDSPRRRRIFVRSLFALVDGETSMREQCALFQNRCGYTELSKDEVNGLSRKDFRRFSSNLKFSFGVFARTYGSSHTLDTLSKGYLEFMTAAKIRNRVTHPTTVSDLEIRDHEVGTLREALAWYVDSSRALLAS
jgi:hypothetical protein